MYKTAEDEMRNALTCLYIATEESVARDVEVKVNQYITELKNKIEELERKFEIANRILDLC